MNLKVHSSFEVNPLEAKRNAKKIVKEIITAISYSPQQSDRALTVAGFINKKHE